MGGRQQSGEETDGPACAARPPVSVALLCLHLRPVRRQGGQVPLLALQPHQPFHSRRLHAQGASRRALGRDQGAEGSEVGTREDGLDVEEQLAHLILSTRPRARLKTRTVPKGTVSSVS